MGTNALRPPLLLFFIRNKIKFFARKRKVPLKANQPRKPLLLFGPAAGRWRCGPARPQGQFLRHSARARLQKLQEAFQVFSLVFQAQHLFGSEKVSRFPLTKFHADVVLQRKQPLFYGDVPHLQRNARAPLDCLAVFSQEGDQQVMFGQPKVAGPPVASLNECPVNWLEQCFSPLQ